jgi:hypothetical protein
MVRKPSRNNGLFIGTATLAIALPSLAMLWHANDARAYTTEVENACRDDYLKYCSGYPSGSASLRLCMESKSKQLSQSCVSALVDAGMVDRRRLKRGY